MGHKNVRHNGTVIRVAVENREVAALKRLGLTEYESRIYLALIKMGPKKASEVSFFAQVPRTKAYGAIRELERKGLLRIIGGKPELYAPSSPNETLAPLVTQLNSELKDSEDMIQSLTVLFESSQYTKRYEAPREVAEFWQIDGRKKVFDKIGEILRDAAKSVNYYTDVRGLIRAYKAHSDALEKARKRGVVVRVLALVSAENASVAQEFSEIVDLKRLDKALGPSFISVDSHELLVIESRPSDLRTDRGFDVAMWTTNKLLVGLHDQFYERIWNSLPPLKTKEPT
jgi:sugar-specific transcriptional regulator TrmB